MAVDDRLGSLAHELAGISEQLADLALDRLRAASDADDPSARDAEALERRITRARRAVEKATALLEG